MDFNAYRNKDIEKTRTADLMALIPDDCGTSALDIGARDGWFSLLLAERFDQVTAVDLEKPSINHERVLCKKGDIAKLGFGNEKFDLVFCSEVLEHIPPDQLNRACSELERVARKYLIIGVPFKQDIRIDRTLCYTCGKKNPPWGHVNSFDENRLKCLFSLCDAKRVSFVGENIKFTNALTVFLLDLAGNPYGTYYQEEPCIHCGAKLQKPPPMNIMKKILTRIAHFVKNIEKPFHSPRPIWIHILFEKRAK
jgi:SAM-dependent methyltransferase